MAKAEMITVVKAAWSFAVGNRAFHALDLSEW